MKIGIIADDFTGATDAASFAVKNGLTTIQINHIPDAPLDNETDVIVISLKSRSCPTDEAIAQSLAACQWLRANHCEQIYFKYCSTFDSTENGNIGPVTDCLLEALDQTATLICPALPVNGRTVYQGHLFVYDELLNESGMRNHPITPMRDANLLRLMDNQSQGKSGLLDIATIHKGVDACKAKIDALIADGCRYIICDAIASEDLVTLGQIAQDMPLVTGGSGLVGGIGAALTSNAAQTMTKVPTNTGKGIVVSGSCSTMTNQQVAAYKALAPSFKLAIEQCMNNDDYAEHVYQWVLEQPNAPYYPMVYATVPPQELQTIQQTYGDTAATKVEAVFNQLVSKLNQSGYNTVISAGGETSGTVTQALQVDAFVIGQEIAPGVPWVFSLDDQLALALKSGNFGEEDFFQTAQDMMKETHTVNRG